MKKFTDRSQKVMALANKISQELNTEYIGTDHIMLGLIEEKYGVGAGVLADLGIIDTVAKVIRESMVKLPEIVTMGKLPQTPRAKYALERASEWATQLGHEYIGTEHILLGLMDTEESVVVAAVVASGSSPQAVKDRCLQFLGSNPVENDPPTKRGGPIPLAAIAPIMRAVMDGHWVRMVDRKIEIKSGDEMPPFTASN